MKKLLIIVLCLFTGKFSFTQPAELMIKNGPKGSYLEHVVAAKEGLFPLGRMYNVHPRHIANFNGIDFNKGLSIGQQIHIPLSDTNFKQNVNTGVPVYYLTTEKESLANFCVKNKVPIANLRTWNNLADDNLTPGKKLVIGFLITAEMQERVVNLSTKPHSDMPPQMEVTGVAVTKTKKNEPEIKKEEPKQTEPDLKKEEAKKPEPPKEDPKKTVPEVKQPGSVNEEGIGYFKNNFYRQTKTSPPAKEQTVTSSIFKTTSGWQDSKYYLLINGVEPGTIVKITNPSNNKVIFAKVLYAMEKVRENQGVDIRISDAAASTLAVTETDKFILKVNY